MKRLTLSVLTIAVLATFSQAEAQQARNKNAAPKSSIGLIDMAHVFQNYEKFVELREDLQAQIAQSDEQAKGMVDKLQQLQKQLQETAKQFNQGSPQYEAVEKQILDLQGEFNSFKKSKQLSLARKESEMLKIVYGDVSKMVSNYAAFREYTVVLRFNRKEISADMQPQEAIQSMNKNVIFHTKQNDITDPVLRKLNEMYTASAGRTRARNVSSSRTADSPSRAVNQ